ncbi:hypothetical protein A2962_02105 [Candidatus Woesebacteria bacterium RIFCSPLOWO2_01_FULL_39_61]|uniref:Proteasome subunit beta n=1 Tax=Candidatus Woesebacteria bacterium RIFCSPHIGHO2_02_FULL_39_13 TaxID=1802505 RepID=A0A1F7YYI6_9BACT|nr:MAG: hypothetical protein A2692_03105 [Candidatus Woesebacteria bacterium RIFCSPHIGHO2_01_FULL_39_95]OGM32341.1 MAG: hypothetical protein A3D01_04740 [Candidatus Woesebacteria bacterium RIFCSPHIGHO2_02_FULL_39_13]OGM37027.1 MAG: hypothetical protein A3E13_03700 [Candidatus Woesebacteria bacterium RIFCSPHIGHO2_12_FULL_40_20]OGM67937.1 MAG: hypothetical protein A2962_02105 [Candidatus Woesebacteria bacterium RIFCSPLOWO2_01_FULL_39_61]OGM72230.1 MAG: hypothetical protein A3H19_02250 [Candidatus
MTLIIGIVCEEGVVVAADGAATLGNLGLSTVRQQAKKLTILQDKIIMGVSGPVGLGQILLGEMDKIYSESLLSNKEPHEAMSIISDKFRVHINKELEAAQRAQGVVGIGGTAGMSAISFSLVALPISKEPCLFQFNQQGAPERANGDLPFVSIGSGQQIADPFLAFIRRVLWKGQSPSMGEAIFAAVWTLNHAIDTNPGGISEPIEVMVLRKPNSEWEAVELTEDELKEHKETVTYMEKHISDFNKPTPELVKDLPKIPKIKK